MHCAQDATLRVKGQGRVFALGDVSVADQQGNPLPATAQVCGWVWRYIWVEGEGVGAHTNVCVLCVHTKRGWGGYHSVVHVMAGSLCLPAACNSPCFEMQCDVISWRVFHALDLDLKP